MAITPPTAHQRRYQYYKSLGICTQCRKNRVESGVKCAECKYKEKITAKQYRTRSKVENRCYSCGSLDNIVPGKEEVRLAVYCETCYLKNLARNHLGDRNKWTVLRDKLEEQQYLCTYTGEQLVLGVNASVDHIYPKIRFPERQYDEDNVEWTTLQVNFAKRDLTKEEFLALVHKVKEFTT